MRRRTWIFQRIACGLARIPLYAIKGALAIPMLIDRGVDWTLRRLERL